MYTSKVFSQNGFLCLPDKRTIRVTTSVQQLTEPKNIVPSLSYGILKLDATVQLHYTHDL